MGRVGGTVVRFLATGILVNGVLFGILALILKAGLDYRVAVSVVYLIGMVWGYTQNRLWSWRSPEPVFQSFLRYVVVYAAIYILHLLFVVFLVEYLQFDPMFAAIFSTLALVVPVFLFLDRFVFKGSVR